MTYENFLTFFFLLLYNEGVIDMYADILVEIKNKHVDKTFTYHVPKEMQTDIQVGSRVLVPFGSQKIEGYVLNLKEECDFETKDIFDITSDEPVLNEETLMLGKVMQEQTLCSLSSCYAAMLPKALKAKAGVEIKKKTKAFLRLTQEKEEILKQVSSSAQKEEKKII